MALRALDDVISVGKSVFFVISSLTVGFTGYNSHFCSPQALRMTYYVVCDQKVALWAVDEIISVGKSVISFNRLFFRGFRGFCGN